MTTEPRQDGLPARKTIDKASALLSMFAAHGMAHENDDGSPTPNATMCLELVRELDAILAALPLPVQGDAVPEGDAEILAARLASWAADDALMPDPHVRSTLRQAARALASEQPGAVGLSDAWIDQLIEEMGFSSWSEWPEYRHKWQAFARAAVERAALAATQPVAPGWMPIETAPSSGLVLLEAKSKSESRVFVAERSVDSESGVWSWLITVGWGGWTKLHSGWIPSRWQPIPPPPPATQWPKQTGSQTKHRWLCLLCKSGRRGVHGTLDDGLTACPNAATQGAKT